MRVSWRFFHISVLAFCCLLFVKCKKTTLPSPASSLTTDGKTEYRFKYPGQYSGTYTQWWFSQGITTTSNTLNYYDKVTLDKNQDSVILIENFGNFTISAQGTASISVAWKTYKSVEFRNDSMFYYYSDLSAMGGSHGYYLKARKLKP